MKDKKFSGGKMKFSGDWLIFSKASRVETNDTTKLLRRNDNVVDEIWYNWKPSKAAKRATIFELWLFTSTTKLFNQRPGQFKF